MGAGKGGCGGDIGGIFVGQTDGGVVGDGRYRDRDSLIRREDHVANVTSGTEPNDPFSYAP